MIIAVDVDGVLANLLPEWLRRYNAEYDDNLSVDQITGWDTHKFAKPECGLKMYDYLTAPDLYEKVEPIAGALEGVNKLRDWGHELAFVTSCTYGMVDQKARWLENNGFCAKKDAVGLPKELVVANTKKFIAADLLIDDGAHNVKAWIEAPGFHRAVLVGMPYNKTIDLTSVQWQRVVYAPAYPEPAAAWEVITAHVERI